MSKVGSNMLPKTPITTDDLDIPDNVKIIYSTKARFCTECGQPLKIRFSSVTHYVFLSCPKVVHTDPGNPHTDVLIGYPKEKFDSVTGKLL